MNRDQYLQKKGWRSRPVAQSAQRAVLTIQGDPALPASVPVAMKSADRDSSPPLRQQSVLPGTK